MLAKQWFAPARSPAIPRAANLRGKSRESDSLSPDLGHVGGRGRKRGERKNSPVAICSLIFLKSPKNSESPGRGRGAGTGALPAPLSRQHEARGKTCQKYDLRLTIRAASAGASSEGSSFPGRARALPLRAATLAGGPERQRYGEDEVGRGETAAVSLGFSGADTQ